MKEQLRNLIVIINLTFIICNSGQLFSQNCLNDSTGLIPIPDLGNGFYEGYQGGLYFGNNTKPDQLINSLNTAILNISPLNVSGNPDIINGKVVLLSIGASNPKTEFQIFKNIADTFNLINPFLSIVNGCQGGKGLQKIIDSTDNYWQYVNNQLTSNSVNRFQVQIIWLEQENTQINNYNFPDAPEALMTEFKILFKILLQNYPNLQICYLNARGYSGYIDESSNAGSGLRQPRDYFHGWAMKWLIENQIMGDTTLSFSGPNRKAPLLDWSSNLWADGNNPRNDGFYWECPLDVKPGDGLHWSPIGNDKAGHAIFNRFYMDEEAKKWLLITPTSVIKTSISADFKIFPNPGNDLFVVQSNYENRFDVSLFNALGELIKFEKSSNNEITVKHNLSPGLYFLLIKTNDEKYLTTKIIIDK